jgi:hypothetical protein
MSRYFPESPMNELDASPVNVVPSRADAPVSGFGCCLTDLKSPNQFLNSLVRTIFHIRPFWKQV